MGRALRQWMADRRDAMQDEVVAARARVAAHAAEREGLLTKIKTGAGKCDKVERADLDKLKAQLEALDAAAPTEPILPTLFYEDVTPEGLAQYLADGWPSASLWSDEAGLVVGSRGMADDSRMRFLALINRFWDGLPFERHRTTAKRFTVKGRRLTTCLMMQPDVLGNLVTAGRGTARGMGFLARFLFAAPASTMGSRLYRAETADDPALARFDGRVRQLLDMPLPVEGRAMELRPPALGLSPAARRLWIEFHDDVERSLGPHRDYAEVADFTAKSADNAARLAGAFHVFEHGPVGNIGADTIEAGCRLATWHLHEAKRIMSGAQAPRELADAQQLLSWVMAHGGTVALRDILHRGPHRLRDRARRDAAVRRLVDSDNAVVTTIGKASTLRINPKAGGGE